MNPTRVNRHYIGRHPGDLTDLDFLRKSANARRAQAMRDALTVKAACAGILIILAFPVIFAVTAASLQALNSHAAVAKPNAAQIR